MTLYFAVVMFALLRALVAGYAGRVFLPTLADEALEASWPFLVLVASAQVLHLLGVLAARRPGPQPPFRARSKANSAAELVATAAIVIGATVLFGRFAKGWVEPHTGLSQVLRIGAAPSVALIAVGALVGVAVALLARRTGEAVGHAVLAGFAGWLILGPQIYARFDDVHGAERLVAAALIGAAFAALTVLLCIAVRGARAAAITPLGFVVAITVILLADVTIAGPAARPGHDTSVVLVTIDTLRADSLDRRTGEGRPLMPRLAEIAAAGVRFTQAVAPSPWTLPSIVSLLSGMNPHRHRVGRMHGMIMAEAGEAAASWLGPALREAGLQAAGFVNNPWLRPYYGLGPGYLTFRRYHGDAADGVAIALSWIRTHPRPFFVFLHLMDPHWPYTAPAGYGEPRRSCAQCDDLATLQYRATSEEVHAEVRRRYDAETAYTDAQLGRLWDELRERGVLEHSWLIVTADHGEEFWDHGGFLHGHSYYDELLRVPLIIVPPRATTCPRGVVASEQVRLEDVAATVIDIAGVTPRVHIDGASLTSDQSRCAGGGSSLARPLVAGYLQRDGDRSWAVRANAMKLVVGTAPLPLLFDLGADPAETQAVMFAPPVLTAALLGLPAALALDVGEASERDGTGAAAASNGSRTGAASRQNRKQTNMDADLKNELRALGYVE